MSVWIKGDLGEMFNNKHVINAALLTGNTASTVCPLLVVWMNVWVDVTMQKLLKYFFLLWRLI